MAKHLFSVVLLLSSLMTSQVVAQRKTRAQKLPQRRSSVNLPKDQKLNASKSPITDYSSLTPIKTLDVRNYFWTNEDIGIDFIVFSPDGKVLASAVSKQTIGAGNGNGRLVLWDLEISRIRAIMPEEGRAYSAAFSSDGNIVASGSRRIRLWDVQTGKLLRDYGEGLSVAISSDGKTIAGGGYGCVEGDCGEDPPGAVRIWDLQTGTLKHTIEGINWVVFSLAFSPNDIMLAGTNGQESVWIWNTKNWSLLRKLKPNFEIYSPGVFSPNGKIMASGGGVPEKQGYIKLWDVVTGKLLHVLSENKQVDELVTSVAFSPDGSTIASGSTNNSVKLWNVKTGKLLRTLSGQQVAFSPDGKLLAVNAGGTIRIWKINK